MCLLLAQTPRSVTDMLSAVLLHGVGTFCSSQCLVYTPLRADSMSTHSSRVQASQSLAGGRFLLAQLPQNRWRAVQSPTAACRAAVEKAAAAAEAAQKECASWKSKHEAALERTNQLEVKVGGP